MTRLLPIAVTTALILAIGAISGCTAPRSELAASGRVVDNVTVVAAPSVGAPVADITSGVTTPTPGSAPKGSAVATLTGLGQRARVTRVYKTTGDRVKAGDPLVRLDDRALVASIDVAAANRRLALAQVDIIDARLSDIADARATIADARATVYDTIGQVTGTRSDLVSKLAQARTQRAQLEAKRAELLGKRGQLEAQLAELEATLKKLPPGADPTQLKLAIAKVKAGIGQIDAGLSQIDVGIEKLTAAVSKIEGALGQIDTGLAQARSGLAKLDSASATTADARTTLRNARATAKVAAQGTSVAIDVAKLQADTALVRAPADGVVVSIADAGDVVVAGAPVATIRHDGVAEIDVWLAPEKAADIARGDASTVRIDSRSETYDARVTDVGVRAVYPPAWLATQEIHLTRAVPVRLTLDDATVTLPPGTPADVEIRLGK